MSIGLGQDALNVSVAEMSNGNPSRFGREGQGFEAPTHIFLEAVNLGGHHLVADDPSVEQPRLQDGLVHLSGAFGIIPAAADRVPELVRLRLLHHDLFLPAWNILSTTFPTEAAESLDFENYE